MKALPIVTAESVLEITPDQEREKAAIEIQPPSLPTDHRPGYHEWIQEKCAVGCAAELSPEPCMNADHHTTT
jgi:hypothetical protein